MKANLQQRAEQELKQPLFQFINNRSFPLNFHLFFSSSLSLSSEVFVDFSFSSHDSSLESQPTSVRGIIVAIVGFIDSVFTSLIWSRLVPCVSAHDVFYLMTRALSLNFLNRCSSHLSPASLRVIFDLSVFFFSASFSFLLTADFLLASLAWQLLFKRCWAIVIVTTRARARWSLLRAIVCASRSIEQMPHIISSVFPTAPLTNEWRYAVVNDLMTSLAAVWLASIEQSRQVQFSWVSGINWCWRDSNFIERTCMCIAQHCLNRKLSCERDDTFLCRSVFSCWTFFILVICSERFLAYEEDCLSLINAESWTIDESSTISFREGNMRSLSSIKCHTRRFTRRSTR